jgi:ribosome-associated protein
MLWRICRALLWSRCLASVSTGDTPFVTAQPMLQVNDKLEIPDDEIEETFVRASGPGGQNVNKVSSAVQLRFDVSGSPSLPLAVKERLIKLAGSRATGAGEIVITANRFRNQPQNRDDARERLADLIRQALYVPKPRKATKPTYGSKVRRIEGKKRRSEVKAGRRSRGDGD